MKDNRIVAKFTPVR